MSIDCEVYLDRVEDLSSGSVKAHFRRADDLPPPADGTLPTDGMAELVVNDPKDTVKLVVGERYLVSFSHILPQ